MIQQYNVVQLIFTMWDHHPGKRWLSGYVWQIWSAVNILSYQSLNNMLYLYRKQPDDFSCQLAVPLNELHKCVQGCIIVALHDYYACS